jgi:hypothetical protein
MARLLLNLGAGTVLGFAMIRAAMPQASRESAFEFRLRRAQWLSVTFGVLSGYLLLLCVVALNVGGVPDRRGMIVFIWLVAVIAIAVPALRAVWRQAGAARRDAQDDARRAAGLPVVEGANEPPRGHRGLTGQDEPPTRW